MTPDQTKRAKAVIAILVDHEPRPDSFLVSEDAWRKSVTNRVQAERWQQVCDAIEADPDLSATTIAERLTERARAAGSDEGPNRAASLPLVTAEPWKPATAQERMTARTHLAAIRTELAERQETQQ